MDFPALVGMPSMPHHHCAAPRQHHDSLSVAEVPKNAKANRAQSLRDAHARRHGQKNQTITR